MRLIVSGGAMSAQGFSANKAGSLADEAGRISDHRRIWVNIAQHYSASTHNRPFTDANVRNHDRTSPNHGVVAHLHASRQVGPRTDMDAVTQVALVVHRRPGVDDRGASHVHVNAHGRPCQHLAAEANRRGFGDEGGRMSRHQRRQSKRLKAHLEVNPIPAAVATDRDQETGEFPVVLLAQPGLKAGRSAVDGNVNEWGLDLGIVIEKRGELKALMRNAFPQYPGMSRGTPEDHIFLRD